MPYFLYRVRDGAGASGPMSDLLRYHPETKELERKNNCRPEVGWAMQVGSPYGRTYSTQDYWQTTYITQILEDSEDFVRFKTGNSEYEWKRF